MSSVIKLGISLLCKGWTIPSLSGYSTCWARPEGANARAATMAATLAKPDQNRKAFVTSTDLRNAQLL
jgi:hypothetical protein